MPCRGELRHVGADLGDKRTCGNAVDARNGVEQGDLLGKLRCVPHDLTFENSNLNFQPLGLRQ